MASGRYWREVYDEILSPHRNRFLDYLRSLAVISVVLEHYDIIELYGVGVDIFFVISGVILSRPFIEGYYGGAVIAPLHFYKRRAFKILPSYLFFLFATYCVYKLMDIPQGSELIFDLTELPQYLFFYRNYAGPPPRWAVEHVWSLCVEEHFYTFLPLFFILMIRYVRQDVFPYFMFGCLAITIGLKIACNYYSFAEYPTSTHNRMDSFVWGIVINLIILRSGRLCKRLENNIYMLIVAIGLIIIPMMLHSEDDIHQIYIRCLAPAGVSLLVLVLYHYRSEKLNFLLVIAYFSYGLYLVHNPIARLMIYKDGHTLAGGVVYIILSLVGAVLISLLIERPFIQWRNRLLKT